MPSIRVRHMPEHDLIAVVEGRHPCPPLPDLQMIVQGELTAVLSAAQRPTHRPRQTLRQHLADAATHLGWQTACMRLAPLLPVRLDTPLTPMGAAAFLTANQPFLAQLLTRYAGMAQVQVTVSWPDTGKRPADPPPMQTALQLSARIGADLATVATEVAPLPLAPGLLYSAVVLLPLRKLGDLDRIAQMWPDGLHIRQIGPDPVTSFATLDLSPVTSAQIDQALSSFGLHSLANLGQLAMARRRRLITAGPVYDQTQREEIGEQAEILAAAARLPRPQNGFALCRIWEGGRVGTQPQNRAVA